MVSVRVFRCWCLVALFLWGCTSQPSAEELAGQAAAHGYELMIAGDYDGFVALSLRADSVPQSYRSQLVDNAHLFVSRMETNHKGLKAVQVGHVVRETELTANVFLSLTLGDGQNEQVLVPMVLCGDRWMMR